jgi:hypothetical protein
MEDSKRITDKEQIQKILLEESSDVVFQFWIALLYGELINNDRKEITTKSKEVI